MRQVIAFNNKNVKLYVPTPFNPDLLPLGMQVYDGDITLWFDQAYSSESYKTTLYYSIDSIANWQSMAFGSSNSITVNSGHTIYFYGPAGNKVSQEYHQAFYISGTGKIDLVGNMLSLCNPNWTQDYVINGSNHPNTALFGQLFQNATQIYNAKDMYIRCSETNYGSYNITFGNVFNGCTNLRTPPNWICGNNGMKVVGVAAFISMFQGCTNLPYVTMPPVNTNPSRTFETMFKNCSSLQRIEYDGVCNLNSNNSKNFSQNMNASGDFYNLGSATYVTGNDGIPSGWTVHTTL